MKSPLGDTPHREVPRIQANTLIKAVSVEHLEAMEMMEDSIVNKKGYRKKRQTSAGSRRSRGS